MSRPSRLLCIAGLLPLLAVLMSVGPAVSAPPPPDLGSNVLVFDPSMPRHRSRRRSTRSRPSRSTTSSGRSATRSCSSRARTARPQSRSLPGRLLHRGRRAGRIADRRHDQRHVDVYNQCLDAGQLHRAEQLLALAVEPDDQRRGPRRLPDRPASSGRSRRPRRCGGCNIDGGNLTLMDYCTAGPQYASGGFIADSAHRGHRHQRLASSSSSSATARIGGW